MIRLEIKNYNAILTQEQQKYQHYHQVKLMRTVRCLRVRLF